VEQGKLDLNDPLSKFYPDFPRGKEVTIHHLLTHTSGIHNYTEEPDFLKKVTAQITPEKMIESIKKGPYDFDPGNRWKYNNSGFFILGTIVEKVSGLSYSDFLKKNFFELLGMNNTGVPHSKDVLEHEAKGYSYIKGKIRKSLNWDMTQAGGAGALYSTVEDLFKWNEGIFQGKVLNANSLKLAFTAVSTTQNPKGDGNQDEGYGYGWGISKERGLQLVSHSGGLNGFQSFLLRYPAENFTVVVLANALPSPPGLNSSNLAHEAALLYIGNKMASIEKPTTIQVAPEILDSYVGQYDLGGQFVFFTRDGNRLFSRTNGPRCEAFPESDSSFFLKVADARFTFVKNEKGEVAKVVLRQGGNVIDAMKVKESAVANLDPKLLGRYVGKYNFMQGQAAFTITREKNRLFAQLEGQPKIEIFPKSEIEFFYKWIPATITFTMDTQGKVTKGVLAQGGRTIEMPRTK
jgi:CubicO group peptidase (beta-lactamase class C family)